MKGLRFAFGLLTVWRVGLVEPAPRTAGAAMLWAPFVGLLLGGTVGAVQLVARSATGSNLLAAVLALAALALLTRALHLDGLADTADGLGCGLPAARALEVMRRGDTGPFGVSSVVLVLLVQVSAAGSAPVVAVVVAAVAGRVTLTLACASGWRAARPEGLGALVLGTVRRLAAVLVAGAALLGAAALGWLPVVSVVAAILAAGAVGVRAVRRFGGITGDVLGAMVEVGTTASLVVQAAG